MKPLLLLPLLLLLKLLPAGPPATVRITFKPLTQAAYLVAKKNQITTKPRRTFPLKKQQGCIVIPTTQGPKVFRDVVIDDAAMRNGHGEDETVTCTYLGYLPDFRCHLVSVAYYEIEKWVLISEVGERIDLWGEPGFAPDKQHIVASCQGIEYGGGQPNIVQLLEARNGVLRQVWALEPKTWEPYRIGWTSASTLLLSKEMWTGPNPGSTYTYAKLTVQ